MIVLKEFKKDNTHINTTELEHGKEVVRVSRKNGNQTVRTQYEVHNNGLKIQRVCYSDNQKRFPIYF